MAHLLEIPASAYTPEMDTLGVIPDIPIFEGERVPVSRNALTPGMRHLQLLPLLGSDFPVRHDTDAMRGFPSEVDLGKARAGGSSTDASAFWDLLDPPMRSRVVAAGFGDYAAGLRRTQPRFPPAMRYALMERWNDCTHSFILGFGEMTLNPADYTAITGLGFDGDAAPLDSRYQTAALGAELVRTLLGIPTRTRYTAQGYLSYEVVYKFWAEQIRTRLAAWRELPVDARPAAPAYTREERGQAARSFIFYIISSQLLCTSQNKGDPAVLPFLQDLSRINTYDWASLALAHLYHGLDVWTRVSDESNWQFLRPLEVWAYEYRIYPGGLEGDTATEARRIPQYLAHGHHTFFSSEDPYYWRCYLNDRALADLFLTPWEGDSWATYPPRALAEALTWSRVLLQGYWVDRYFLGERVLEIHVATTQRRVPAAPPRHMCILEGMTLEDRLLGYDGFPADDFLIPGDYASYLTTRLQARLLEVQEYSRVPAQRYQELYQRFCFARSYIARLYPELHERELEIGRLRRHQSRQASAVTRLQMEVDRLRTRLDVEGFLWTSPRRRMMMRMALRLMMLHHLHHLLSSRRQLVPAGGDIHPLNQLAWLKYFKDLKLDHGFLSWLVGPRYDLDEVAALCPVYLPDGIGPNQGIPLKPFLTRVLSMDANPSWVRACCFLLLDMYSMKNRQPGVGDFQLLTVVRDMQVPAQRYQELYQRFCFARSYIARLYPELHERELEIGRLRRHQSRQASAVTRLQMEVDRLRTRLDVEGFLWTSPRRRMMMRMALRLMMLHHLHHLLSSRRQLVPAGGDIHPLNQLAWLKYFKDLKLDHGFLSWLVGPRYDLDEVAALCPVYLPDGIGPNQGIPLKPFLTRVLSMDANPSWVRACCFLLLDMYSMKNRQPGVGDFQLLTVVRDMQVYLLTHVFMPPPNPMRIQGCRIRNQGQPEVFKPRIDLNQFKEV
ncbi:hypothetical protein JCGZ_05785 [Jatropha curcas]|uniref:Aminotransferase-like plant mobile domain-containing protein n=1 Tax=Jatropha curcas TaxID=180498 RepID=A0A067KJK5_JATCU|nr:hypothetical protein JCGZ_05785 [Jatropha curcas]